jgi:hypothetical protein
MDAIQAVVELARENEELQEEVKSYEDMMEKLVGAYVSYCHETKKKKYYDCTVDSFDPDTCTWHLVVDEKEENGPETFDVTFDDFVSGRLWITEK